MPQAECGIMEARWRALRVCYSGVMRAQRMEFRERMLPIKSASRTDPEEALTAA